MNVKLLKPPAIEFTTPNMSAADKAAGSGLAYHCILGLEHSLRKQDVADWTRSNMLCSAMSRELRKDHCSMPTGHPSIRLGE
jgi:hypothetical protein